MTDALKKLRWVEGIVTLFKDSDWAKKAYDDLQGSVSDDATRRLVELSRQHHLETKRLY